MSPMLFALARHYLKQEPWERHVPTFPLAHVYMRRYIHDALSEQTHTHINTYKFRHINTYIHYTYTHKQRASLLRVLRERASDKMPAVRAKALSSLAACLPALRTQKSFWDASPTALPALHDVAADNNTSRMSEDGNDDEMNPEPSPGGNTTNISVDTSMINYSINTSLNRSPEVGPEEMSPGVHVMSFAEVVRRRSRDQKSAVRKAAVQVRLVHQYVHVRLIL